MAKRNKVNFIHQYEKINLAMGLSEEDLKEGVKQLRNIVPSNIESRTRLIETVWNSELSDELVIWTLLKIGADLEENTKTKVKIGMGMIDENGIHDLSGNMSEDVRKKLSEKLSEFLNKKGDRLE